MKRDLREILSSGLEAADPGEAVRRSLRLRGNTLRVDDASFEPRRIFVLAAGKAAGAMALAAEELLGERIAGGLVVTKEGHFASSERLEVIFASHPEPDERGVEAARCAGELAESLGEEDLLLALISGGASALLADPAPPIELEEFKQLTNRLLRSGAHIGEINTVRKHVSALKGGGLARLAAPAGVAALLLSDVVGDDPSAIASGPTVPDPTTLEEARDVLRRFGIEPAESIASHLRAAEETPKPGDPQKVVNVICGGGHRTAEAAANKARELGYEPLLLSTLVTGEASAAARLHAAVVKEVLLSGNPLPAPCALITGGETTVIVGGEGTGGPNQEFALALAIELGDVPGWAAFSVDTDGNDGPTPVAGGIVDGGTERKIGETGLNPGEALARNDARAALEAGEAALVTGPTGTNVNDLRVVLVNGAQMRHPS